MSNAFVVSECIVLTIGCVALVLLPVDNRFICCTSSTWNVWPLTKRHELKLQQNHAAGKEKTTRSCQSSLFI